METTCHYCSSNKDLYEVDYIQLYDFLKFNQAEVDEVRARRLSLETASQAIHDAVTTHQVTASHYFMTASGRTDSNADLEDSSYDSVTNKMRCLGLGHYARNCTVRPRRRDAAYLQTQLPIDQKEEAGIQLQAEEFDLIYGCSRGY
ncbi:hypothetical protein Tco_1102290 [Tanacetum coccineum]